MKYALIGLGVLVAWFTPLVIYKVRMRRWYRLPGHNPYKPGARND